MNTKLLTPTTITRTLTDRIIFEVIATGELQLWDATHSNLVSSVTLTAGKPQSLRFELYGARYCGAAVIQQSEWDVQCRGESSVVLGNVDFPYLGGATYRVYPQKDRTSAIDVEFEKTATGAAITLKVEGGKTTQRCEVPMGTVPPIKPLAFSLVLTAFTENIVSANGGQTRIEPMPGGGEVTFTPSMPDVPNPLALGA